MFVDGYALQGPQRRLDWGVGHVLPEVRSLRTGVSPVQSFNILGLRSVQDGSIHTGICPVEVKGVNVLFLPFRR